MPWNAHFLLRGWWEKSDKIINCRKAAALSETECIEQGFSFLTAADLNLSKAADIKLFVPNISCIFFFKKWEHFVNFGL